MIRKALKTSARAAQQGFAMPALIAMLAVMAIALMIAMPSWRYLVRDDKEQELIFRGRQISMAIARFQRKNGNALPTSFDQLVQGKYLRKPFKDPMTPEGKWRILRPGEGARPQGGQLPGGGARPTPTPTPSPTPVFGGNTGGPSGPIGGVASLSTESGLRMVNGSQVYNQWIFAPNIPLLIGGLPAGAPPRGGNNQVPSQQGIRGPDLEAPRTLR